MSAPIPKPPPRPSVQQAAAPAGASSRAPAPALRSSISMSGLPADLGRLLETKQGADVDFEVCGKVFAAHKLVLAARSSVFMEDFFGPAKEKATGSSHIRICDMHPDAFEALLHYLYTDSLPATVTNAREEAAVIAQDLIVAADRYNLKDLKPVTENKLCKHSFSASTVLPMLVVAEHHQCWKLMDKCLEFIAAGRNTRAIMATDDVEHLARRCPSVVKEVSRQDSGRKGGDAKQPSDESVQFHLNR
ncbi:BTB/POZ and MATH domain-containing protein 2-like [Panicum virgatum]|uniref:BTB/POZ and MATH domain-containing protein 2-like n=1 Tax=Panicum virgatum TaxID=38727 RepID=UPI0019D6792A|nr:BTB/POZ and MATH domain-containing protein 2-like [Panicum virgatum]